MSMPRKLTDEEMAALPEHTWPCDLSKRAADRLRCLEALLGEVAAKVQPVAFGDLCESGYCDMCDSGIMVGGEGHKADCLYLRLRAAVEG